MPEKISTEEAKKLIFIKGYVDEFEKLEPANPEIAQLKDNLILQLKTLLIPLAQNRMFLKELEDDVNDIVYSDELDHLFRDDPVTQKMMQYMKVTKSYDLNKEQAMKVMCETLMEVIEATDDIKFTTKVKTEFLSPDDVAMKEEEIETLKSRARRWIMFWKKATSGAKKLTEHQIYKDITGHKQRFAIVNDLFYEETGEYVLDRIKREKEKQAEKPKEDEKK